MTRDTELFDLIEEERTRQLFEVELIASENYVSDAVKEASGSILTNKYAEGLPGKRYYGGCEVVDKVEQLAIDRAKKLFGAKWVNVQPHSGSQANAAVMLAVLKPGDKLLGFDLAHGGHLTHGSPVSFSGRLYQALSYGVDKDTGLVDYEELKETALRERPKLIICGASAYSRDWDYEQLRQIADEVGALLMADISHTAGLIAKDLLNDPLPYCHIVTTTTHKTLRGPRGGMIMMGQDFNNPWGEKEKDGNLKKMSSILDLAVFPGTQGGPLEHIIAAKAVSFKEALSDDFTDYSKQVIRNCKAMAKELKSRGYKIVSDGTDNHCFLIDLTNKGISGKKAERLLGEAGIIVNKNMVPYDERSPFVTSGIRVGTPAITTLGLKESACIRLAQYIDEALGCKDNKQRLQMIRLKTQEMMRDSVITIPTI